MYLQPTYTGWIEVICGPMFSGKTEELIRRLRRVTIAKQKVKVFKPACDDRYAEGEIVTHVGVSFASQNILRPAEILAGVDDTVEVVAVDEVQFFDDSIVDVVEHLANEGRRVICAGLDLDYKGEPFGPMPLLMAKAEYVTKTLAICTACGNPANRSYRLTDEEAQVIVGAHDHYEPRCRRCYTAGLAERAKQRDLHLKAAQG